jgi:vacuolar-type H+-ATPase subunit I/STV1
MDKLLLRLSGQVYRLLLWLYPADFRRAYGRLMLQLFGDTCRDAYSRGGATALGKLWLHTRKDTLVTGFNERLEVIQKESHMSRRSLLMGIFALILCAVVGYINVHTDETGIVVVCMLIMAFVLGLIQPKAAWRWGLLVGLSIPASYFIGFALNTRMVDPPRYPITLAVLVLPALVSAYSGALFHRVFVPAGRVSLP